MDTTPRTPALTRRRLAYGAAGLVALLAAFFVLGGNNDSDDPTAVPLAGSAAEDHATTSPPTRATTSTRTERDNGSKSASGDPKANGAESDASGSSGATVAPSGVRPPPRTSPPVLETIPPNIVEAYTSSYVGQCESIWNIAGSDGVLYDAEDPEARPFVVEDCTSLLDEDEASWWETVDEARENGAHDALWNFDEVMYGRTLRNANNSKTWTNSL